MNITYHKEVFNDLQGASVIPHICLSQEIQQFIDNNVAIQHVYHTTSNDWYFFIHLTNGDRIDVQL